MRLVVLVVRLQHGGVANSHLVQYKVGPLVSFLCNYFLEKVQAVPSITHSAYCPIAQNVRPKDSDRQRAGLCPHVASRSYAWDP
jgi:hypothetical protein